MYLTLKTLHVAAILLSVGGLILRRHWMQSNSALLQRKIVRILPHVVDTILLLSGIALIYTLHLAVLENSWLIAKLVALVIYIALAAITMRTNLGSAVRSSAFAGALAAFLFIAGAAITKSAASWWVYLQ